MSIAHGNKIYVQLLLDPHRTKLMEQAAEEAGQKKTAWMRDALYKTLERTLPSSIYNEAAAKDESVWRESIRKRVEGRKRSRDEAAKAANESA